MAAALPEFDAGGLNISQIREVARRKLIDILDSRRGKKILVLDQKISGFLGLLTEVSLLKEHGVEQLQHLTSEPLLDVDVRGIIFLVRSKVENAQLVAKHIKQLIGLRKLLEFSVIFLPRTTIVCERVFQEEGISADIVIGELPLELIPFDYDVLSLELGTAFREVTCEGDWSSLFYMARGILQLQNLFGSIPLVKGVGEKAKAVADSLEKLKVASKAASFPGISSIDELILIDREVDCVTPLCTQLTYEGLLDEVLGIKNGSITLEAGGSGNKQRVTVNSADKTYEHIRDWHVGSVGIWLNEQAKSFHSGYKGSKAAELKELKEFTTKLKSLPQIQRHIDLLSAVQAVSGQPSFRERIGTEQALLDGPALEQGCQLVEDLMANEEKLPIVLRLLCLTSLTQGGIPKRQFDSLRRDLLHTYGHQHLLTLSALQKSGLLKIAKGGKPGFQQLRKGLHLLVENIDPRAPSDAAYVFSGYAPIAIRLVEAALRTPAWSGISEETVKTFSAPPFVSSSSHASQEMKPGKRRTVLIAFIGGITFAEIAALRFLQDNPAFNCSIVIATTKLINGNGLMESFQDPEVIAANSSET